MTDNFKEIMIDAVEEVAALNQNTVKDFDCPYEECFPAMSYRTVVMDGKERMVRVTFEIVK